MWLNGGWTWGPWMMIFPFLFLALFVLIIGFAWRVGRGPSCGRHGQPRNSETRGEDARAIVDRRYATGELSREEWEQMRRDLDH